MNIYNFNFSKRFVISLKAAVRERDIFHLLNHSTDGHKHLGSPVCVGTWGISCSFSQAFSQELECKWSGSGIAWGMNNCPYWMPILDASIVGNGFTYITDPVTLIFFSYLWSSTLQVLNTCDNNSVNPRLRKMSSSLCRQAH